MIGTCSSKAQHVPTLVRHASAWWCGTVTPQEGQSSHAGGPRHVAAHSALVDTAPSATSMTSASGGGVRCLSTSYAGAPWAACEVIRY